MTKEFKSLVLREGKMRGFHENHGYMYQLNGSFYLYKGGNMFKVGK